MALDVLQVLKNKFLEGLEETKREGVVLPFHNRFSEIEKFVKELDISSLSTFRGTKDELYDLNCTLADCRLELEQLRFHKINKVSCHSIRQFWLNEKLKRKLSEHVKSLTKMNKNNNEDSSTHRRPRPPFVLPTSTDNIRGFDDQTEEIIMRLLEPDEHRSNERSGMRGIGIVGTGGSGKSTLAGKVFKSPRVENQFSVMIWASLGKTLSKKEGTRMEIFKDMLRGIQKYSTFERMLKRLEEEPDDYLLDKYIIQFQRFLLGKRSIIVLDDVWDTSFWYGEDLDSPLDLDGRPYILSRGWLNKTGGTIMVTSRLEEVAKRVVGEKHLHPIQRISKEDCWSIFTDAVDTNGFNSHGDQLLAQMKEEIKEQCDGLPLAAHTLAKIIPEQIKEDIKKKEEEIRKKEEEERQRS